MVPLDARAPDLLAEVPRLLQSEANLFQLATIFWGLWTMPLGWLSYRSGLVPRLRMVQPVDGPAEADDGADPEPGSASA